MKKKMGMFLVCVYVLMLGIWLVGCGKSEKAETNVVAYVIAPTACSQGLNLSSPLVTGTVEETVMNYGRIYVVNADGEPSVVADQDFDIEEVYKNASETRLKMDARSKTTSFLRSMSQVIADDEEVDYLKSIQLAARSLSSLDGYDNKMMIVVGTGLSTAGVLNFRNNLLMAEPEAVADALQAQGEIPDLQGLTVYWQQLADVAPPQETLNGRQRQALQEIWSAVIQRGGGRVIFDEMVPVPVSEETVFPRVSVVDLPAAPAISFDEAQLKEAVPFHEPLSLSQEQICFAGDSAEYVDAAAAKEVLSPVAETLMDNPEVSLLLCGCIAGDGMTDYGRNLSLRRAEAVMQTLMDQGVSEDQLIVLGLGSDNPWHIKGVGYEGELAAQNRKVVLLNAQSPLGIELMGR